MRIGIIGTGAMASLFAARLSAVAQVVMIGTWRLQIDTVNQNGLTVCALDGRETVHQVVATDNPTTVEKVDAALVLTKSYQTLEAAERVAGVLAPDGVVVTLQNGLGNLDYFVDLFGRNRCTVGVTSIGATLVRPSYVRHAGDGDVYLAIPAQSPPLFTQFAQRLRAAQLRCHVVERADSLLWSKVAINAGINPLTALYQLPNGQLVQNSQLRKWMVAAAQEAAAVAATLNVTLSYDNVSREVERIANATATNRSSMLQDITRGAPTEIDAICGAIVKFGRMLNVPTPVNAALFDAIVRRESGERAELTIQQLQLRLNSLQLDITETVFRVEVEPQGICNGRFSQ